MFILDTNVVSELMLPVPNASVVDWVAGQAASNLYLSTVTEAELRFGVEILPTGARRDRLLAVVEGILTEDFAGRILPFDSAAARAYALVAAARRAQRRSVDHADCQIAAIALSLGASVATRDTGDFEGGGIEVVNPWASQGC